MTGKVLDFKTDNRKQVLREADIIRSSVSEFNEKSEIYKIDRLVLASNKLTALYGDEDTVFISFKTLDNQGYKDNGFVLQGADELTIEVHRAQAQNALDSVKDLLSDMCQSGILKFKPLIELETSKYFKKNVAKEIYNTKSYNTPAPLEISWNSQKDFFESQEYGFKVEKLKEKASSINGKGFKKI